MSYSVVYCDECKVLLFDPDLIDSGAGRSDWEVNCPVCKRVTKAVTVPDLSDL